MYLWQTTVHGGGNSSSVTVKFAVLLSVLNFCSFSCAGFPFDHKPSSEPSLLLSCHANMCVWGGGGWGSYTFRRRQSLKDVYQHRRHLLWEGDHLLVLKQQKFEEKSILVQQTKATRSVPSLFYLWSWEGFGILLLLVTERPRCSVGSIYYVCKRAYFARDLHRYCLPVCSEGRWCVIIHIISSR